MTCTLVAAPDAEVGFSANTFYGLEGEAPPHAISSVSVCVTISNNTLGLLNFLVVTQDTDSATGEPVHIYGLIKVTGEVICIEHRAGWVTGKGALFRKAYITYQLYQTNVSVTHCRYMYCVLY